MTLRNLGRGAALLASAVFVAGCSVLDAGEPESRAERGDYRVADRSDNCRWNRSSCIYEGSYERDERAYAEAEARRLNQASISRLRRSSR